MFPRKYFWSRLVKVALRGRLPPEAVLRYPEDREPDAVIALGCRSRRQIRVLAKLRELADRQAPYRRPIHNE